MKQLVNLCKTTQTNYSAAQIEKEYQEFEDNNQFVWGIKSCNDLTSGAASLYSMNDIDITYNNQEKAYMLSIETIYAFPAGGDGERGYILSLFNELTSWMQSQGYNTKTRPTIYDIFTDGHCVNTHFKSLDELYATFKCMVIGFCG